MGRITLFGRTSAEINGRIVSTADMGGVKPRQILEILALEAGSPVTKDRLADLLWEGKPPGSYIGTLESYVCVLRRTLGLGSGRLSLLATTTNGYRLDPQGITVDLDEFFSLTEQASTMAAGPAVACIEKALRLVSGELLADEPYAVWAVTARDRLRREVVTACTRAARLAAAAGAHAEALRLARIAVDEDPSHEEAVEVLMRALWLSGRRCEALRVYAEMRQWMLDELGDEPGIGSRELYLAILRDSPTAQPDASASNGMELRTLLRLLRLALEATPGVDPPASDAALTLVATRALMGVA
jgi:DNA-binding SARP family transcriptional activator